MKVRPPRAYVAVYYTAEANGWPLDVGDDPSFLAHRDKKGGVTWGVCRPDLRNALEPSDVVIFFATTRRPTKKKPSPYWFVGFATVAAKISQDAIWTEPTISKYQRYSNLLIRPRGNAATAFEYHEPCEGQFHHDWLWRLVKHRGKKKAYVALGASGIVEIGTAIRPGGGLLSLAENYIIFETDPKLTRVLEAPPIVARATQSGAAERWAVAFHPLRSLIFPRSSARRSLRTKNPRNGAHRHVRLVAAADGVREALQDLVADESYRGSIASDEVREAKGETKSRSHHGGKCC